MKLPEKDYIFQSNFFPVPSRYITISNSGPPAKRYEYFSEALELIGNLLNINGLQVFQVGDNNDPPIQGTVDFRSKLSIHQVAFVVQNSALFVGPDNVYLHFAKDIPSVLLNNVYPKQNSVPKKGTYKPIVLEPERKGKWSFNLEDRVINTIKPEEVAHAILRQLKITSPINFETIKIGENFKSQVFEYVPDFDFDPNQFQKFGVVGCRLDLHFDLARFERISSFMKVRVLSRDKIPVEILRKNRDRILEFVYFVEELDERYIEEVNALGLNFAIVCENKDRINDFRLALLGKNFVHERKKVEFPLDKDKLESSLIRTNKFILGRGKMYPTVRHYRDDITHDGKPFEVGDLLEDEEVLADLEHFYIFKHIK